MAKITSNGDNSASLADKCSDRRTKQVYRNKVGFLKNFPWVLTDF